MKREQRKILRSVDRLVNRALRLHNLIEPNDRILVGISGGIDSLVLLHLLANRRKFWANFSLSAMHVNITNIPYSVNRQYIQDFCQQLQVQCLWHEETIPLDKQKNGKNPCFICSWNRRKALFSQAEKLGFNKLALAHHRDDAIETLLMNMIYHGSISSLPEKLRMFGGNLILIRPLLYLSKQQILQYAQIHNIQNAQLPCKFSNKTARRTKILNIIQQIQQANPNALDNMLKAMGKIFPEYLPNPLGKNPVIPPSSSTS